MDKLESLKLILSHLLQDIRKQDFLVYFKKMSIVEKGELHVTFGVISEFMKWNLTAKFYDQILKATKEVMPTVNTISFEVDSEIENPGNENALDCLSFLKGTKSKKSTSKTEKESTFSLPKKKIHKEKYTLNNYVVWPDNQLAHSACSAISKMPGKAYNPIYIYGDVWLWKTHLLQATGNEIQRKNKEFKVLYTTADKFLNEYVSSVKKRTIDKLRDKYRGADVLVVDDVQFLENKNQTQNELYNIFNLLYESEKQIILSWDRPPKELTELEPRLRSRFEWWITIDIGKPDFETRLAIIQEKARQKEFLIPQEVAEFIASNVTENVRELEGILNQLIIEYELDWTPPSLEKVARKLKKLSITDDLLGHVKENSVKIKSYDDLLDVVSDHFGIEKEGILGENRKKEFMIPRQVAMYLLKKKMNYTYERIWNIFNGRNHASVLYSCKKLETVLKKDKNLLYEINIIRDKIGL